MHRDSFYKYQFVRQRADPDGYYLKDKARLGWKAGPFYRLFVAVMYLSV